uniref:Reverse transcriptase domain-containing protein n=2 Tax=Fagus sylvatica TaxID=28930 RepID=A0A2N9HYS4_FAGSY
MATEPSGSSSTEARMSALEERFDEPINLVHLMAKRDVENDARNNELHLGGKNHTKPPPQQPKLEDQENQRTSEVDSKLEDLEERIRLISGLGSFGNTDFASMSWFLNMEVPYKFKAQDFVKYNGTSDPMIYLQMYCRKMARNAGNEPLLIQTFQDFLLVKLQYVQRQYDGPPPRDFNPNATCEFHFGAVRHSPENCKVLKHRVQDLLDHGILKFKKVPNIKTNPLLSHLEGGGYLDPVEACYEELSEGICEYHSNVHEHNLEDCEDFKKEIVGLCEWGIIRKKIAKPAKECMMINRVRKVEEAEVDNLSSGLGGITRSGRCYTSEELEKRRKELGKAVEDPLKKKITEGEVEDFLRIIKNSEDSVVKQLNKMPTDILVLSLLLALEVHKKALVKVMNEAHMPEDITAPSFENMVAAVKPKMPKAIMAVAKEFIKLGFQRASIQDAEVEDFGQGQRREDAREEHSHSHIKTTFPAPAMVIHPNETVKLEDKEEEELILLFAEDFGVNTAAFQEIIPPLIRLCEPGEIVRKLTVTPLPRMISGNEVKHDAPSESHVTNVDDDKNCSTSNMVNSDEEIDLPYDMLEALERQNEGSKPNIEELESINLLGEGEEPKEIIIEAKFPDTLKDELITLLREYRDIFACPKDNFPLPHIDTLVDNTATNVVFSFMDGFLGYNQIKMVDEDKLKTAFVTHWGTFVYDVMPFGLKNVGATYQRAMVTLFHDMIHQEIEVYVDDMIAKSHMLEDHMVDLLKLFQHLRKYRLRLNPNKCVFGVTSRKLLGFIVSGRGIEIDPTKVQAIRNMPAPKTEKEI